MFLKEGKFQNYYKTLHNKRDNVLVIISVLFGLRLV